MVEQAGYPMGPLQLCDLVGNDVALAVLERMYEETKDRRNAPPALLTSMVEAGLLGNKSGRGFYTYDEKGATDDPGPVSLPRQTRGDELPLRLVAPYLNEALRMVQTGYAIPNDIDTGMQLGCRMPGPFQMLAEIGPKEVLTAQQAVFAETAEPGDKPVRLLEQLAYALAPRPRPSRTSATGPEPLGGWSGTRRFPPPRGHTSSMGRKRPSKHTRPHRPLSGGHPAAVTRSDGEWLVRPIPVGRSEKAYLCPGCGGNIAPGLAHVVVWPRIPPIGASSAMDYRRHWHSWCWDRKR